MLLLGLYFLSPKGSSSPSFIEVKNPSTSEISIRKIKASNSPSEQEVVSEEVDKTQSNLSQQGTILDLSDADKALLLMLPKEQQELALQDEKYRESLKKQFLEPTELPTVEVENWPNPYEGLVNDSSSIEKFDPSILPEGENNPYRELLGSGK